MSSSPSTQPLPDATTSTSHLSGSEEILEYRRNRDQRALNPSGVSDTPSRNDTRRQRQNAGQRRRNNSQGPGRNKRLLASSATINSELDATSLRPQSVRLESPPASTHSQSNNHRRRTPHTARGRPANSQGQDPTTTPGQRRRAARFNAALSEPNAPSVTKKADAPAQPSGGNSSRKRTRAPPGDDLTSILTFALSNPPFPECMICFNPILPGHPTWSCSPKEEKDAQSCWNTFHLKCIKPWAEKSVKDTEDAWRARGEERKGEWRCPGCQSKREIVPRKYW
jgi:transcriptional repressor NF-X1